VRQLFLSHRFLDILDQVKPECDDPSWDPIIRQLHAEDPAQFRLERDQEQVFLMFSDPLLLFFLFVVHQVAHIIGLGLNFAQHNLPAKKVYQKLLDAHKRYRAGVRALHTDKRALVSLTPTLRRRKY
jgi:hypothetical protein